jgi:hypothetical protein
MPIIFWSIFFLILALLLAGKLSVLIHPSTTHNWYSLPLVEFSTEVVKITVTKMLDPWFVPSYLFGIHFQVLRNKMSVLMSLNLLKKNASSRITVPVHNLFWKRKTFLRWYKGSHSDFWLRNQFVWLILQQISFCNTMKISWKVSFFAIR